MNHDWVGECFVVVRLESVDSVEVFQERALGDAGDRVAGCGKRKSQRRRRAISQAASIA